MTLADFTSSGLIMPRLRSRDVPGVIQELSQAFQKQDRVPDLLPFYRAALNREFLASTDLESGMAFPHARLPGLRSLSFAFGRSDEPLRWSTKADTAVRLVFLTAVPTAESGLYLKLVSGMVRLAKDNRLVESLGLAQNASQIFEVFQKIDLQPDRAAGGSKQSAA